VRDELNRYYENELLYIRQVAAEFAQKHSTVASHLLLGPNGSDDPHVERLIEAFAFLAARIHLKIDDDFPEISESLLNVLYPHYLRPIPSLSIVEFRVDPKQDKLAASVPIGRETLLHSRVRVDGVTQCSFRTCYDAVVSPLRISQAKWTAPELLKPAVRLPGAEAVCSVELSCFPDVQFKMLALDSLRLYLNGERALILTLYELLFNKCARILLRNPNEPDQQPIELPPNSLRAMGFRDEEAILPFPRRSFTGYRIVQEYFSLPEKFFFAEINNLRSLVSAGFTDRVEIVFVISRFDRKERQQSLELGVSENTFKLGCTPVVNLFKRQAEPILLDQTKFEYPVTPRFRWPSAYEVFSIDEVRSSSPNRREVTDYEPFYSSHHGRTRGNQTFWYATRRPSNMPNDPGTDMHISLVDISGKAASLGEDTLTVQCTCTNRDLPARLQSSTDAGDFELQESSPVKRIVALQKPTSSLRPPLGQGLAWRLISHLSLNYLSLVEEGRGALQEILKLYNFADLKVIDQQISSISDLQSRKHFARVVSEHGISFARGIQVDVEFDEETFAGSVFLFASILEHFLGLYVSLNSFSQLAVRTKQRKEVLRQWQPRAGQRILL
jgi:type VI secretion system protein ImpG